MNEIAKPVQTPTAKVVELSAADLPARCPMEDDMLWFWHPRVYLPVAQLGHAKCPYCGTEFKLKEGESVGHGH